MLNGVSLHCAQGEICAVLGANGAGKSTLFKIITGLIAPTSGTVEVLTTSKKPIGGIIEKPSLYPYLTARENLKIFASMQGVLLSERDIDQKLTEVGLTVSNPTQVSKYSMGMKQRLGIAIALLNDPQTLVWDEPFSGLDPMGTEALKGLIIQLAKEKGLAIILSSHIMGPLLSLCDTLYVLKDGNMLLSGTLEQILDKYITTYEIRGNGLSTSNTLKGYESRIDGNKVIVKINEDSVTDLIKKLLEEGVEIASVNPIINFQEML